MMDDLRLALTPLRLWMRLVRISEFHAKAYPEGNWPREQELSLPIERDPRCRIKEPERRFGRGLPGLDARLLGGTWEAHGYHDDWISTKRICWSVMERCLPRAEYHGRDCYVE
jgi:hypothetical protein